MLSVWMPKILSKLISDFTLPSAEFQPKEGNEKTFLYISKLNSYLTVCYVIVTVEAK